MLKGLGRLGLEIVSEKEDYTANPAETMIVCDWPTEPGIWMGKVSDGDWFPMQAKLLKEYPKGEPHLPMPIVTRYPQSATNWPFTFKGCHPVNEWRKPTPNELSNARKFYGLDIKE